MISCTALPLPLPIRSGRPHCGPARAAPSRTGPSRAGLLLTALPLAALSLLLPSCSSGGGGDGGGVGGGGVRPAETVVFLTEDHRQILGARDDGNGATVPLSGTAFTEIRQWAVSPDGGAVAYVADADGADRFELYVREIDGAAPRKVSVLENAANDVFDFAWAPDSRSLAYRADGVNADAQMFRVGRDGTGFYKVWFHGVSGIEVDAVYAWSPDSRWLALGIEQSGPVFALLLHDAATNAQGAAEVESTPPGRDIRDVTFSPDSQWIAWRTDEHSGDDQYEVFRRPTDLSAVAMRSNGNVGTSVRIAAYQWSHDSRYLAQHVESASGSADVGVNVYDLDQSISSRLATSTQVGAMAWARQQNRLCVAAAFEPGVGATAAVHLLVFDIDAAGAETVSNPFDPGEELRDESFAWSPDGAQVAYATALAGFRGRVHLAAVGSPLPAVPAADMQGGEVFHMAWSPDGSRLAVLELDQTQAFHPGEWHLLDGTARSVWRSGSVNTYETSRRMAWSGDSVRAVHPVAPPGNTNDLLRSTAAAGGTAVTVAAAVAARSMPFDVARASLAR